MEDNMKRKREMPCDNGERDWTVKNLPAMRETWLQFLGQEDPLEKGMATPSSNLAWRIPWTEEPGGLQPMGLQKRQMGLTL